MVNNIWYYTRIYAVFVPRWLFLCVESAWVNHTWPRWGEMFSELIPSVPRLQIYWSESSPPPPPESALLHQFTVKLQSTPGAVWMSARRPVLVFNEVIRTTQIPSIVYPGPGPTWFHLFFPAVWMHKCEQGWKSWLVIFKLPPRSPPQVKFRWDEVQEFSSMWLRCGCVTDKAAQRNTDF